MESKEYFSCRGSVWILSVGRQKITTTTTTTTTTTNNNNNNNNDNNNTTTTTTESTGNTMLGFSFPHPASVCPLRLCSLLQEAVGPTAGTLLSTRKHRPAYSALNFRHPTRQPHCPKTST